MLILMCCMWALKYYEMLEVVQEMKYWLGFSINGLGRKLREGYSNFRLNEKNWMIVDGDISTIDQ